MTIPAENTSKSPAKAGTKSAAKNTGKSPAKSTGKRPVKRAKKNPDEFRRISVSRIDPVGRTVFKPGCSYRVKAFIRDQLAENGSLLSDDPAPRTP